LDGEVLSGGSYFLNGRHHRGTVSQHIHIRTRVRGRIEANGDTARDARDVRVVMIYAAIDHGHAYSLPGGVGKREGTVAVRQQLWTRTHNGSRPSRLGE